MPPKKNKSPTKPQNSGVNKTLLDNLLETLNTLRNSLGSDEEEEEEENQDLDLPKSENDVNGILNALLKIVKKYGEDLQDLKSQVQNSNTSTLEGRLRAQEDELDESRQRSLKGNLIVSSISYSNSPKPCLLKSDEQLNKENLSLTDHIISVIREKYSVVLPPQDIQACHRLPTQVKKGQTANVAVVLRIWNRKIGSAWSQICEKIKSGVKPEMNVYLNFQLTRHRSALLHDIRHLRKENKIAKFYVDENAKIQIKVKDTDRKLTLTYFSNPRSNDPPKTYSIPELRNLVK